jgi:hypothetical protein
MRELLLGIRGALRGRRDGPVVRLPLAAMRHALGAAEPLLLPVLPLTAGQLASFANPSDARPTQRLRELGPFRTLRNMLDDLTP